MNNIFVGNLSFKTTKEELTKLFEPFGTVANVVIMEKKKGKSRGFGFVDMPNEDEKNAAIAALEGREFMCRVLSVSVVIPKVKGEFKPRRKDESRTLRKHNKNASPVSTSESSSKYYSKFDGPPKPWRKSNTSSKSFGKKNEGSRPYYGKSKEDGDSKPLRKDSRGSNFGNKSPGASKPPYKKFDPSKSFTKTDEGSKFSTKPKISKGFKMFHKVSGASKTRPKKSI